MTAAGERSILVAAALAVAAALGGPSPTQAQDSTYTTVTGRLDPRVEVKVKLDRASERDRWLSGHVGSMSVPVPPANTVHCTMISIPELSPDSSASFLTPLRKVKRLQARRGEGDTWTTLDLGSLLEAEPRPCNELGTESVL